MPSDLRILPAGVAVAAGLFPRMPLRMWRRVVAQIGMGATWQLAVDDRPSCIFGIVPIGEDVAELWLAIPAPMRGVVGRLASLRFLARACAGVLPDHALVARIDDTNRAGQRFALAAGFSPLDERLPGTTVRTWVRPPPADQNHTNAPLRNAILQWVATRET